MHVLSKFFFDRYMDCKELIQRLQQVNSTYRSLQKRFNYMKDKIASETKQKGISLDEECDAYIQDIAASSDVTDYLAQLPDNSFMHLFWPQQVEASSRSKNTGKLWHPLFIRWCLYLKHR